MFKTDIIYFILTQSFEFIFDQINILIGASFKRCFKEVERGFDVFQKHPLSSEPKSHREDLSGIHLLFFH